MGSSIAHRQSPCCRVPKWLSRLLPSVRRSLPDNLSNMLRFLGSAQQPLLGLGEALLAKYPGRFALKPVQLPKGEQHSS